MFKYEKIGDIGRILLDRPKQLNALNQELFNELEKKFHELENDDSIAVILLDSTSERAFCAGGDVKEMYLDFIDKGRDPALVFEREFAVDKLFTHGKKPLVSFWRGITMGGGIGLSIESDYLIGDESVKVAMPETQLGLFPDVGVGYYFSKMNRPLALYLTMTGNIVSGSDVLNFGWIDALVRSSSYEMMIEKLGSLSLIGKTKEEIISIIDQEVTSYKIKPSITKLDQDMPLIEKYFDKDNALDILDGLEQGSEDFAKETYQELRKKCPTSLVLVIEKYVAGKQWTKDETFDYDLKAVDYVSKTGNLKEGVRTTMIDKNDTPKWNPENVEDVDVEEIRKIFQ
ncbi:MAG: enoyl-CoA hydratase/isomerase family protein [Tissierellia bacterium]|nr:enoyl-CoA hydratase/isomerase family protein [Tissierellia bacterium]